MATMTADDLPAAMADALLRQGADLDDETICLFLLARDPALLMREIKDSLDEAIAIAAEDCERKMAEMRRDIEEMRR